MVNLMDFDTDFMKEEEGETSSLVDIDDPMFE